MTLPVNIESIKDVWGVSACPAEDRSSREFPLSSFTPVPSFGHTIDYWERERILAPIQSEITEIKIILGMASRWPRPTMALDPAFVRRSFQIARADEEPPL